MGIDTDAYHHTDAYHETVYTQVSLSLSVPKDGGFNHHTVLLVEVHTCFGTLLAHFVVSIQQPGLWFAWSLPCASLLPQHDL